jgi:hypothetical protein
MWKNCVPGETLATVPSLHPPPTPLRLRRPLLCSPAISPRSPEDSSLAALDASLRLDLFERASTLASARPTGRDGDPRWQTSPPSFLASSGRRHIPDLMTLPACTRRPHPDLLPPAPTAPTYIEVPLSPLHPIHFPSNSCLFP